MMYNQKFAAAIKVKGKVLREFKDTVYVPFASEYSILLKNINTRRALVNVFVDGENAVPGGLVINAGQEVDLERWIKNGNLSEGNKFKFIERTAAIENGPRGIKLEDGLIRVEFQFEAPPMRVSSMPTWQQDQIWNSVKYGGISGSMNSTVSTASYNVNGVMRSADFSKGEFVKAQATAAINQYCADNNIVSKSEVHDGMATMDAYYNDAGITVPGSKSTQSFSTAYIGALDPDKHTMVIKLLGETPNNKPVLEPVTVKAKPKCVTCGKLNKANAKFCSECGTALEIFA